ncbi:GPW/gp25 family protein [Desulfobacter vibrioformis]|uniref:GPW/gp25 family protein n=1 Tax=Desulfobacter vibrioformis TaxID=34031 RepID=UPI000555C478|nr:GPW/gp25 family protein [Desulfobacter vibrioformis]
MAFMNKFIPSEKRKLSPNKYEDIIQNLNHILNTKKEYGGVLRDFGIRDLNEFNNKEGIIKIVMDEVVRNIQAYEPRLTVQEIESVDSHSLFQLSFKIRCMVKDEKKSLNMVFDSIMNSFLIN